EPDPALGLDRIERLNRRGAELVGRGRAGEAAARRAQESRPRHERAAEEDVAPQLAAPFTGLDQRRPYGGSEEDEQRDCENDDIRGALLPRAVVGVERLDLCTRRVAFGGALAQAG